MDKNTLNHLKDISFYGMILVTFGSSYYVGDYLLALLYKPTEKEYFPARMKNKNYKIVIRRRLPSEILEPLLNSSRNISSLST
jgi:hypothetical protein